jgi:LacI family transcriptional regulator
MPGRRPTLNDLSESLGLSANTVSRALTGKDGVSQRTRELVLQEAQRIGYTASHRAAPASRDIALVVTSATNVFISQLITAIEAACRAADYSIVLHITEESAEQEEHIIKAMLASQHAGAIVIPVQADGDPWRRVAARMPIVSVAREIPGLDCDTVGVDARSAMYAATRHMLGAGARSVLMLEEDRENSTVAARLEGFEQAIAEEPDAVAHVARLPARHFESSLAPWQAEEAFRRFLEVLDEETDFDGVLVADDYYALGVMAALKERGLSVPDDVLLMGYGNHAYSGYTTPSLSTIGIPATLIGEIAVSLLIQRINGDVGPVRHRLVKTELVLRESTVATRIAPSQRVAGAASAGKA